MDKMNNHNRPVESSGTITLGDIYFVLFRHKWKIILFALAGVAGAVAFYVSSPPLYQSEAKLFIRYITDARPVIASAENNITTSSDPGGSVINSEIQILTSFDLAQQVAQTIGPEKILAKAGGGNDLIAAAALVQSGLKVSSAERSSVINVIFQHPDPTVVRPVLTEIIADYLSKHSEIHQALGTEDDFLAEQTTQLRMQIAQTERELMMAKTNMGIISLDTTKENIAAQISKYQGQLYDLELELATRQAMAGKAADAAPAAPQPTNVVATVEVPADKSDQYKKTIARLALLQKRNDNFAAQGFSDDNVLVKEVAEQIRHSTELKSKLEVQYPGIENVGMASLASGPQLSGASPDPGTLPLALLETKVKFLHTLLSRLQSEAAGIGEVEPKILDLQRKEKIQDDNLQFFIKSSDEARMNEALGAGKISNIKPIQQPTPPSPASSKRQKIAAMLLVGGVFGGLALAFLIELLLDRTVKRPTEIETKLKLPLFLSIPNMHLNGSRGKSERRQLSAPEAGNTASKAADGKTVGKSGMLEIAPWSPSNAMRSFYEALRDRIVVHFEVKGLTRNPKLVAVTSANRGAGVTTIAMGLAASLSETGEGNVLLVDMNVEQGAVQQFYKGKPGCPLDHAFESEKRGDAMMQNNLYVVGDGSNNDKLPRIMPKRFSSLLPKFKASDYDYIIFDMPPVTQTSVTPRLAGHMDMVLLVVEAEKTDRDIVLRANSLLGESKANVIAVLNKTRKYVPEKLHQEYLSDS
jgi:succinoglycan biosynthesis transport protein ExoP